jgi:diguanylate cyclase (GGDEF)-like protein
MDKETSLVFQDRYRSVPYAERSSFPGGVVAFDSLEKRNVVLLELHTEAEDERQEVTTLEAADRIDRLTELDHPSVIKVFDYFVEDGRTFLVVEPLDAVSFTDLFSRERAPALSNILRWADDLFDVLIYLHSLAEPFLHNDITPANIWLTRSSNINLCFPAVRRTAKKDISSVGVRSALPYRSLEYLWDDIDETTKFVISRGFDDAPFDELLKSKPDERSDIYSLSAALYFAMAKVAPTDAMTRTVNILDGAGDPVRSVSELNDSISESISAVVMKGLSVKRAERYHSAYEMRMDLLVATAPLFDSLTRLPNPVQFNTHLRSAIDESTGENPVKFSVMLVQLNNVNEIYSRFGRLLGDEATLNLSERIRQSVRVADIVGRVRPDMFSLLLFESGTPSDIEKIASRLQSRIAEPLIIEDSPVQITSTVGTAVSGLTRKEAETFFHEAESAIETASENGPNSSAIY